MIELSRAADGSVVAVGEVVVGVESRRVEVPLGPLTVAVDAGGLRNAPVVVASSSAIVGSVTRGASSAGAATVVRLDDPRDPIGGAIVEAAGRAEVVVAVVDPPGAGHLLVAVRALEGRPLPVVPFDDLARARAMLDACWVDIDVALPAIDGPDRAEVRQAASELGLFEAHHVVEVDPRPGLAEVPPATTSLEMLAAASTGVLAARIAAGNRRWR